MGTTRGVPTIAPMSIAPSNYDFGPVTKSTTAATTMPIILSNNDAISYSISSIQVTGTYAGDFLILQSGVTNNCVGMSSLAAGASCNLVVTFTPSTSGGTKETAKITVNDNANNTPQTVFLKGTGN
jgi:trimeric autotransporter adhesin